MTPNEIDAAARRILQMLNRAATLESKCYAPTDPQFNSVIAPVQTAIEDLRNIVAVAKGATNGKYQQPGQPA